MHERMCATVVQLEPVIESLTRRQADDGIDVRAIAARARAKIAEEGIKIPQIVRPRIQKQIAGVRLNDEFEQGRERIFSVSVSTST